MTGTPLPPYDRGSDQGYISVTMEFRCNLACTHCMIEGTMDRLRPTDAATFEAILVQQAATRRWRGLTLTGAEITLRADLPDLAQRARAAGFETIRIQSHGMRLARPEVLDRLVRAGVNEFFLSVTAGTQATHDAITKVPGSWARLIGGLEALSAHPADLRVITNTVVTAECVTELAAMVEATARFPRVIRHEFWGFFPMAEEDHKGLIVPFDVLVPHLRAAHDAARALGRGVEVKNVPECLLGDMRGALRNGQPELVIDPDFWTEFDRNGFGHCPHRGACASSQCLGLTTAYVKRFGMDGLALHPLRD